MEVWKEAKFNCGTTPKGEGKTILAKKNFFVKPA
jgi:hypothetical protein